MDPPAAVVLVAAAAGDELGVTIIGACASAGGAGARGAAAGPRTSSCSGSDLELLPTTGRLRDVLSLGRGGRDPPEPLVFIIILFLPTPACMHRFEFTWCTLDLLPRPFFVYLCERAQNKRENRSNNLKDALVRIERGRGWRELRSYG